MSENTTVQYEILDNIGIIKGVNPPVNALSHSVRSGLINSLTELTNNQKVEGIVLIGDGRTFFAGADISEEACSNFQKAYPQAEAYQSYQDMLWQQTIFDLCK